MARVHPHALYRPSRPPKTFETVDPATGVHLSLRLRYLKGADPLAFMHRAGEYLARHVTGIGEPGKAGYVEPELIGIGPDRNEWVELTEGTCRVVAAIEMAQVPEKEEDRYEFFELVQMLGSSTHVAAWFLEMFAEITGDEAVPNPSLEPIED